MDKNKEKYETSEVPEGPVTPIGKAYLEDTNTIKALTGNVTEEQRARTLNQAMTARLQILKIRAEKSKRQS